MDTNELAPGARAPWTDPILGLEHGSAGLRGSWRSSEAFGVQANYTLCRQQDGELRVRAGMYENEKLSVRVAYNWRDTYFRGTSNIVGIGRVPLYNEPYGWLDASIGYQATENIRLSLQRANLLDTMRESYYGEKTRRHENIIDDVRIIAAVSIRL